MFLIMLYSKIAQQVLLHWTKKAIRADEKKYPFKDIFSCTTCLIQNVYTETFLKMPSKITQIALYHW